MLAAMLCMALAPAAASAAAPPNDDFAAAQPLITGVAATGDNTEAGTEAGEPVHSTWVAPNRSVWFTWTAPSAGLARISACGSAFDTVVAVYGGSSLAGIYATRIANNDNGCADSAQASMVHVRATAGTTYRIALDGWGGGDAGAYSIVADVLGDPGAPPANDGPDAAPVLAGAAVHATGTNAGATSGWNEWPADATQLVYWRWTSPVDGQVRVDTCASGFDTVLGVLRRTSDGMWNGGALARRGCGDRAAVTLDAVKGQEYWIGVGGEAGTSGAIDLRIDATPDVTPPMTTFSSAPGSRGGGGSPSSSGRSPTRLRRRASARSTPASGTRAPAASPSVPSPRASTCSRCAARTCTATRRTRRRSTRSPWSSPKRRMTPSRTPWCSVRARRQA